MRDLAIGVSGYAGLAAILGIHFSLANPAGSGAPEAEYALGTPAPPRDLEAVSVAEPDVRSETISPDGVEELETTFDELDYGWPPETDVPPLIVDRIPPDLTPELEVERRKAVFFRTLLPLALMENDRVRRLRAQIEAVLADGMPETDTPAGEWLAALADRYRVPVSTDHPDFGDELLKRVDVVPPALTLAQAAIESGWGTSRFTREANNVFGIWSWDEAAGVRPERREAGKTHVVRRYETLRGSVRSYVHMLNTGHAYEELRARRAEARRQDKRPDAVTLAGGLSRYSERGEVYVHEVRGMIRSNDLAEATDARLCRRDCELDTVARR